MSVVEREKAGTWTPASPFLDSLPPDQGWAARPPPPIATGSQSPFLTEYEIGEGEEAGEAPLADSLYEFLSDVSDEEFGESLEMLVAELSDRHPVAFGTEHAGAVEAAMHEYLAPLAREAEAYVERAAEALAGVDPTMANEVDVSAALEAVIPPDMPSPAFEQFFSGLKNKLKKLAGKAVGLAKKGIAAVGKFALKPLLAKLGGLVKPLLAKVVQFAMDKIPEQYRPLVAQIAAKLGPKLGIAAPLAAAVAGAAAPAAPKAGDAADAPVDAGGAQAAASEAAAPDPAQAQQELDLQLAEIVFRDDRVDGEMFEVQETRALVLARDPLGDLDRARARFIREIGELGDPEATTPIVENFVPAILMAVRTGIQIIGRPKVVGFLGGLIGKFIAPLVGKESAPALGKVIADLGLKTYLQAEVDEATEREAAASTVASTVEDTVRRVATLPAEVLEQPEVFEALAYEAFQEAVAASFPTSLVRPDLRETDEMPGAWVFMPARGPKLYKKYSQVRDVRIPAHVTHRIPSFGGSTLGSFLRDRMRVDPGVPIQARVHIYEAIPHTRLSRIAANESVRGLGSADAGASSQLHPLNGDAAALLLGAPRMGRETDEEVHSSAPFVGQRLYFLEVATAPSRPLGRESHVHMTIDLPKQEIVVCLYLSEVLAQRAATSLRKKLPAAAIVADLRAALRGQLSAVTSHRRTRLVRIRTRGLAKAAGSLASTVAAGIRRSLKRRVAKAALDWTWAQLAKSIEDASADFIAKTDGPEDGVRVCLKFHAPEGMEALQAAFRGQMPKDGKWPPNVAPRGTLTIHSGPKHD